ncbi:MAG: zinc ribbon domain-containing protein [Bacillota bacterium]
MNHLKTLWDLQQMRLRYQEFKNQLKTSPLVKMLEQARQQEEGAGQALRQKEERYHRQTQALRRKEMDYETSGQKRESLRQKLYGGEVANPKELHNLERQLESAEKEINHLEEELVNLTIEKETLNEQLVSERENWESTNNRYLEIENKYETWKQSIEAELSQAAAIYRQLSGEVAPELLSMFNDLRRQFHGKVLARVESGACGGCRVMVPMMILNQIRAGQKLVRCESCGRVLYLESGNKNS